LVGVFQVEESSEVRRTIRDVGRCDCPPGKLRLPYVDRFLTLVVLGFFYCFSRHLNISVNEKHVT